MRKTGTLPWLRPDAKSQVTFVYEDDKPVAIDAVVLSTQHHADVSMDDLQRRRHGRDHQAVLPAEWIGKDTKYHINPTGRFEIGGPMGDCGLTGRKIIVDTYGGMARHGGGAFSGKDPSKVDRSAAYAARYVAKNIVAAGLADRCEIQVSYAIGVAEPTSISVRRSAPARFATPADRTDPRAFRPDALRHPADAGPDAADLQATAAYGHFGREDID